MITYSRTDSDNPDFQQLVTLLDADLAIRCERKLNRKGGTLVESVACYRNPAPVHLDKAARNR